jgi:hypothetical protein
LTVSFESPALPVLLPGITLNTSATDYRPIKDAAWSNSAMAGSSWSASLLHGN